MTYPPQGPYGQQPDPYGQQQPDPYGQQQPQQPQYGGGYPPQTPAGGQQYGGGYDPNAQYGGGYTQYGGVGGPPPKNNKGPIIAIVSIVVLILAGVGVTGFVAPGFFLSDDSSNNNAGSGSSSGNKDSGADAFIDKLVKAADAKDKGALEELQCSDASSDVKGATNAIDEIESAELKDSKEVSDKEATATMTITVDGNADDYEATVVKDGSNWCWKDITNGTGGGSSEETTSEETTTDESSAPPTGGNTDAASAPGIQFIDQMLKKVNAGDAAGAKAMLCSDSSDATTVDEVIPQSPQISINFNGEVVVEDGHVTADLTAVLNGEETTGWATAFEEDAGWCVYIFSTY